MSDKCLICGLEHDMKNTMGLPDLESCIQTLQADNGRLRQENRRVHELSEARASELVTLRSDNAELLTRVKQQENDARRLSDKIAEIERDLER